MPGLSKYKKIYDIGKEKKKTDKEPHKMLIVDHFELQLSQDNTPFQFFLKLFGFVWIRHDKIETNIYNRVWFPNTTNKWIYKKKKIKCFEIQRMNVTYSPYHELIGITQFVHNQYFYFNWNIILINKTTKKG